MKSIFLFCIGIFLFGCTLPPPGNPSDSIFLQQSKNISLKTFRVTHIIDGDTIVVLIHGKKEKIRFVGIDTPETKKEFTPVECFADEATNELKRLLSKKSVVLLQNKTGDNRDKYDRLLRYVFVDGKDVGAELIKNGYAFSFQRYPHDRLPYYSDLEWTAQMEKRGMWHSKNCSYW